MTPRYLAYVDSFLFPHECAYEAGHEGDLNHVRAEKVPGDSGGLTKWGIDRRSHPDLDIEKLTAEQARQVYWDQYWTPSQGDAWAPGYGEVLTDIRVNGGDGVRMLQRALNALGSGLKVDGAAGPLTIAAAGRRGLFALLHLRQHRYETLAEAEPQKRQFLAGWTARNHDLARFVGVDVDLTSSEAA